MTTSMDGRFGDFYIYFYIWTSGYRHFVWHLPTAFNSYSTPVELPPITEEEVVKTINVIPNNKAPGALGIPNEVIKFILLVLTGPLI